MSWKPYRWATGLLIAGYLVLLVLTLGLATWRETRSEFKVSGTTEAFNLTVSRTLRLGPTPVRLPAAATRADCARASLVLPPGTALKGLPGRLVAQAQPQAPIGLQCEGRAESLLVMQVEIPAPRPGPGGDNGSEPRLAMRIAGVLNLGGELDEASPATDIALLRSAKISIEVKDLFGSSIASTSERLVDAGYRLTFRRDPQGPGEPEVEGLLLVRPHVYDVVVRFSGHSAVMTPPGAGRGTGSIVAPTFLDQVKGQAPWGAAAIALGLVLGLLEVFRSYAAAPKDIK